MVQLVSIHFYFGKTKCYFLNALSETSKLERNPSRPFVPLICPGAHLSAEVSGLLAHTVYGNIQGIASLCLVSLQSKGKKTISACLGSLSQHFVSPVHQSIWSLIHAEGFFQFFIHFKSQYHSIHRMPICDVKHNLLNQNMF